MKKALFDTLGGVIACGLITWLMGWAFTVSLSTDGLLGGILFLGGGVLTIIFALTTLIGAWEFIGLASLAFRQIGQGRYY